MEENLEWYSRFRSHLVNRGDATFVENVLVWTDPANLAKHGPADEMCWKAAVAETSMFDFNERLHDA